MLSLNSSLNFTVNGNTPRRDAKRACQSITNYDPRTGIKPKFPKSGRIHGHPSKNQAVKPSFPGLQGLISCVESGSVDNALQLFEKMKKEKSFVWNVVIRVLTDNGYFKEAIGLYHRMCFEGVRADNFTFPFVIKACGGCLDCVEGRKVNAKVVKLGLDLDVHVSNSLILMYAKFGFVVFAEKVFEEMPVADLVSWNSMINAYILVGDGLSSLMCIQRMQQYMMEPDRFTIMSALSACSLVRSLPKGKEIHGLLIKSELGCNPMVQTSLIDMYGKCGDVNYAERFFNGISDRDISAWNAMIGGYALNGKPLESFSCLRKMLENQRVNPDIVTLINLLPSCSQVGSLLMGQSVHSYAIRIGFLPHIVLETALIDMYGKCGEPKLAELVFSRLSQRNLVSRNTMISAHMENSQFRESLKVFWEIWNDGLRPDAMTITGILPAYSEIALLREGKQVHGYVIKTGLGSNTFVLNSLAFMYAKCGDLKAAQDVFDGIYFKDVSSWNTIIMAYAIHGYGLVSHILFSKMTTEKSIMPNTSTFVSLLTSCSVSGMVEEGWNYFVSMKKVYGIDPGIEHYGCMLDLLGRVGDLHRARQLITEMPLESTSRIWGSLLAASRHHRDLELAEFAAKQIFSLENDSTGLYILLANMYAEAGRWEDVRRIKALMKCQGFTKTVGSTVIDVHGKIYRFTNHDRSHKKSSLIYDVLDIISRNVGEKNHCVGLSKFKPDEVFRKRANSAGFHSVRLAVCYGLVSMSIGKPVLVRKNVRICKDCHGFMKKVSVFCNREIVVGDSKIYHHFRQGQCSCNDYW